MNSADQHALPPTPDVGTPRGGPGPASDDPGWLVTFTGSAPAHEPSRAAQTALADGVIGTAGSAPLRLPGSRCEVIVGNVYLGTGAATDLLRAPTWTLLEGEPATDPALVRVVDLRSGTLHQEIQTAAGPLQVTAFSSLAHPGVVGLRAWGPGARPPESGPLDVQAVPEPPSLPARPVDVGDGISLLRVAARPGGVAIAAHDRVWVGSDGMPGLDRLGVYVASPRRLPAASTAARRLRDAQRLGLDILLDRHRAAWARRWDEADIQLAADPELQRAVRFSLYHLIGFAPNRGEAAVGARGLTGPAYRGHVFWDADVFVLPFFAATHPRAARAMLEYRVRRLPAALENATAEGQSGAWFPWESARDGHDVTPRWVTGPDGRPIRIWAGDRQLHIVADVAWAASTYTAWTGDAAFAEGPGRRIFVETARFWASRIELDESGRGHLRGVVGPDEYHELIDDNAYTNVMARWNLRHAARAAVGDPSVTPAERACWEALAAGLVDGYDPATGRHEQFAGFSDLEPVMVRDLLTRPVAADTVLGRERVEVSQVVKQADVLMLHHLVPEEVAAGSLVADLDYYEPRTAHGSSLSPGVHAALLARAGRLDDAVAALAMTARLDLDESLVSAAHGMHSATMGGLWQALVVGFGGIRPSGDALLIDPRMPGAWGEVRIPVRFRGGRVRVRVEEDRLDVRARPPALIAVGAGAPEMIGPRGRRFRCSEGRWEPA
jgi:hypothetical protein